MRSAVATFAVAVGIALPLACSSVPDVVYGDGDGGSGTSGTSGGTSGTSGTSGGTSGTSGGTSGTSGNPDPLLDASCPDRPPASGGICCGNVLCVKCANDQACPKCTTAACAGSSVCCALTPGKVECTSLAACR